MIKLECIHADTCLPDYWGGHHLPHVQIIVWPGMSLADIKKQIKNELAEDAIAGSEYDPDNQEWHDAAITAVDAITPTNPEQETFFNDVEEGDENDPSVYAFFVFRVIEDQENG